MGDAADILATTCQPQAILRPNFVQNVEALAHPKKTRDGNKRAESDQVVHATKNFHSLDASAIRELCTHFTHEFFLRKSPGRGAKVWRGDVGEEDASQLVLLANEIHFACAERALAIEKYFERAG